MYKKTNKALIVLLIFLLLSNNIAFATVGIEEEVSAYLIGDYETGEILEEYNIYKPVEIASITKLMTYTLVMDAVNRRDISLEDKVLIEKDVVEVKGSSLNLEVGDILTVEELLRASIVISANDATYALAKYVAGNEDAFVDSMNEKAKKLNLESAVFFNSTGLPKGDFQNTMSPVDIFNLSRYIIANYPELLTLTSIPYLEMSNGEKERSTNPLLGEIKGVDGLKTGFTNKAGYCLVSTVKKHGATNGHEDFRLIAIAMGTKSEDKRKEVSGKLVEYALDNYSKRNIVNTSMATDIIHLPKAKKKDIEVYPVNNFSAIVKNSDNIEIDVHIDEKLKLPLRPDEKVGTVVISKNGEFLEDIDLVVHEKVKKENILIRIFKSIMSWGKIFPKNVLLTKKVLYCKIY